MARLFPHAHATHPQWGMACALVLAQLRAQMALPAYADAPALGILYITDHYADHAEAILEELSAELPLVTDWAGTVGVGVCAGHAEYIDEPALAVMLCDLPPGSYRVFSGVAPLAAHTAGGFVPHKVLVHADAQVPELPELIGELAERADAGFCFGGLAASRRSRAPQFATSGSGNVAGQGAARGVFSGGMSGVAFAPGVDIRTRIAQGCRPVGPARTVTEADGNLLLELDGAAALDALLADRGLGPDAVPAPDMQAALATVRATLAGVRGAGSGTDSGPRPGRADAFGRGTRVRHIVGLDPNRRGVAIAEAVPAGSDIVFCERSVQAARAELVRVCAEIRDALEPAAVTADTAAALDGTAADAGPHPARRIAGALYVSCASRGGAYFGAPGAELQLIRHALGDVPLVGFFAGGEIAGRQIHGYSGVLTVFATA